MNEPKEKRWAEALKNQDFYLIETYSGYRSSSLDPLGKQHILPSTASAAELGDAVLDALRHSRFLSLDKMGDFFDIETTQPIYVAWMESLMKRHGYKSKQSLFKSMMRCGISLNVGEEPMTIRPSYHKNAENWVRAKDDGVEDVFLPVNSCPDAVDQALLLAFSRCI
jgi:hypothetical protein